jgi:hypothetical protein
MKRHLDCSIAGLRKQTAVRQYRHRKRAINLQFLQPDCEST